MTFLKLLVGDVVLPTVKAAQPLVNRPIAATVPSVDGSLGTNDFFRPL